MAKTYINPRGFALFVLVLYFAACSVHDDDSVPRAIPGTEQVAIYDFCISVSPDEKWLAYTEWSLPKDRVFKDLPADEYESRIVTLNIETGESVRHTVSSIPPSALGFSDDVAEWIGLAGVEIIEDRFRPPGWKDERFYFQPYDRGIQIWLDPREPGIQVGRGPDEAGQCSDCAPVSTLQFGGRVWDLIPGDVSAVFRNGMVRTIYYQEEHSQRSSTIVRIREDGSEEVVIERQHKAGTFTTIMSVRCSPDERYLAYVVHSKKDALMSGPREELFITELRTRVEKRVAAYAYMGNLIWSAEGARLYFAGGAYSSNSAVRVVDVRAAFSR